MKLTGSFPYSVFTMSQMVQVLHKHGRIDKDMLDKVLAFIEDNRFDKTITKDGGDVGQPLKRQKKVHFLWLCAFCNPCVVGSGYITWA